MGAIPPMERRILIVESQNDFALSMASVLKGAGYQTAMANSAADAQRELQKRRPDLVVLRAELPDQSGFVLCGQIKKGRFGQALPVLLLSSDVGKDGLTEHSQGTGAADAYLSIPFEMTDLAAVTSQIVPLAPSETNGAESPEDGEAAVPPPMPASPGGPPKIPRRERRSAITEEDKGFLDRAFQSIADRKAELIAESHQLRRSAPRRELMSTPEGKIQVLREELKFRESQLARISEIWAVRERELLSVEDRLHEKDVEVQGLKMQVDDLLRRFNDAQQAMLQKEREHGATVDDLLLQRVANEKDLIEVVASKEKEINVLRQEVSARADELSERTSKLESTRSEFQQLEKQFGVATLEFEVKEQKLTDELKAQTAENSALKSDLEASRNELAETISNRDSQRLLWEEEQRALGEQLERTREERDVTVRGLETQLTDAQSNSVQAAGEIERLKSERLELESRLRQEIAGLESGLGESENQREQLRADRDQLVLDTTDRLRERDSKIAGLELEIATAVERFDQLEADLNAQIQQKHEQLGELEGEVEASRAQLADREQELGAELSALSDAKNQLELQTTERLTAAAKTIADLEGRLSQAESENQAGARRLDQAQEELSTTREALAVARGQLAKAAEERTQQASEIKAAHEREIDLSEQLSQVQTALSTATANHQAEQAAHRGTADTLS